MTPRTDIRHTQHTTVARIARSAMAALEAGDMAEYQRLLDLVYDMACNPVVDDYTARVDHVAGLAGSLLSGALSVHYDRAEALRRHGVQEYARGLERGASIHADSRAADSWSGWDGGGWDSEEVA